MNINDLSVDSKKPVGVGLRDPHYKEILNGSASVDFVEVHAENFFVDGGPARAILKQVRQQFGLSLHATSLGLGARTPILKQDLVQLKELVSWTDPLFVSDHASFSWIRDGKGFLHGGDLLPIPFNDRALDYLSANVDRVQQTLGRRLLVENISSYLALPDSTLREFDFLQSLCVRTGAGLLLDINNIYVNTVNSGVLNPVAASEAIVADIDGDWVGEIHLAGSSIPEDGHAMIDDHGAEVSEAVWQVYRYVLSRMGAKPTLVEWDTQLPALEVLVHQAELARTAMESCCV